MQQNNANNSLAALVNSDHATAQVKQPSTAATANNTINNNSPGWQQQPIVNEVVPLPPQPETPEISRAFAGCAGSVVAMPGSAAGGKSEDNRKISLKRQSPGMGPMLSSGSNSKTTTPLHHVAAVVQPHIKEEVKPTLFSLVL